MIKKTCIAAALAVLSMASVVHASALKDSPTLLALQHEWAHINYEVEKDQKEAAFASLAEKAHVWSSQNTGKVESLIWQAIIESSYAGAKGGLGALSLMEEARDLLLKAESMEPAALNGSIYTSLGSFYYMTPGWPIGFGDDDKALEYLNKAMSIAPNDMDANYFMGDYWLEEHKYKKATKYLQEVIDLPAVENRPIYSQGRKAEALAKLKMAKKHMH